MAFLAARTTSHMSGARVVSSLSRSEVFIWACAIVFLNQLFGAAKETMSASPSELISQLGAVGVFQLMAWFAVFRLLIASGPAPAQLRDLLVVAAICCFVLVPSPESVWLTALGLAIYGWLVSRGDQRQRAAAIVLAALSVQEFWGRVVFKFFALPLLRAETVVVGTMLQAIRPGTVWRDNVITGPNGHSIVLYDLCSSFHNLSLAALCWVTVRNLRDRPWQTRDFLLGGAVGLTMVLCNVTRLCLMAWDEDLYRYWHWGDGKTIFDLGASTAILALSLYGSRANRRAP